ncbi:MAG: hypothetical protein ABIJ19_02025, partial [Patescibacteria group bacterium]
MMPKNQNEKLKELIKEKGLVFAKQRKIVSPNGQDGAWLFDLRAIFLDPEGISLATDTFWQIFEKE